MLQSIFTSLLRSFVDKYVANIRPDDVDMSWGGVAMRNIDIKVKSLQRQFMPDLTPLASIEKASVGSLTINVPWTSLGSTPVTVGIDDVEVVIALQATSDSSSSPSSSPTKSADPKAGLNGDKTIITWVLLIYSVHAFRSFLLVSLVMMTMKKRKVCTP